MQRSILELLNGRLIESIKLYPATIPIFIFLILATVYIFYRFNKGEVILRNYIYFLIVIIGTNYLYKVLKFLF